MSMLCCASSAPLLTAASEGRGERSEWHKQRGASAHTHLRPVASTRADLLATGVLCQRGSVCRQPGPHAGARFGRNTSGALFHCQSVPRFTLFWAGTARPQTSSTSR